jgi:hypothetical protein
MRVSPLTSLIENLSEAERREWISERVNLECCGLLQLLGAGEPPTPAKVKAEASLRTP